MHHNSQTQSSMVKLSFGITAASSTSAAGPSASPATPTTSTLNTPVTGVAPASEPKPPSQLTGKTVGEILSGWHLELQESTEKFKKQAKAISEWDSRILRNRDVLTWLESEVSKVVKATRAFERDLELIDSYQGEMDKSLRSIEEKAERLYLEQHGSLFDDAGSTRDEMYEQAEEVERELQRLKEQLKSVINSVNARQVQSGETPMDAIVQVLNNQLTSLMRTHEKAEEVSARTHKLLSRGSGSGSGAGPSVSNG